MCERRVTSEERPFSVRYWLADGTGPFVAGGRTVTEAKDAADRYGAMRIRESDGSILRKLEGEWVYL